MLLGVGDGEEQPARLVFDAVTGEVQQQHVIWATIVEEVFERKTNFVVSLVHGHTHIEVADARVTQYGG